MPPALVSFSPTPRSLIDSHLQQRLNRIWAWVIFGFALLIVLACVYLGESIWIALGVYMLAEGFHLVWYLHVLKRLEQTSTCFLSFFEFFI